MPVEPMSADQSAPARPPYADTLAPNSRPALSATSDMPQFNTAEPEATPVDSEPKPAEVPDTSAPETPEGEADDQPQAEAEGVGEGKVDKTTPQQRAIITRERNRRQAAEQRATALETKVDQLIEVVSKLTPKPEQPKEDPRPTLPRRDAFDTPDAYEKALDAHDKALEGWSARRATEVATREAEARQAQQQRDRQAEADRETWDTRVATFSADHPDFSDVVYSDDLKISPIMTMTMQAAEDGPAIAYHLAQNPEVAERLYGLGLKNPREADPRKHEWTQAGVVQQAIEIGKISARLAQPAPKPRPAVIRPLQARNSASDAFDPNTATMDEYNAWRNERLKSRAN